MHIAHFSHNRHNRRWCTFFKLADFFPQRTQKELLWAKFIRKNIYTDARIFCDENTRYTISNFNKEMRQPKHQVGQLKQHIHHLHQKNTPTKTPHKPYLSKEYANQNTMYANQNTYSLYLSPILIYAVLSRSNFCREFTHFFGVLFTGLENALVYKKWQIWGMPLPTIPNHTKPTKI